VPPENSGRSDVLKRLRSSGFDEIDQTFFDYDVEGPHRKSPFDEISPESIWATST
jgi:hypothetical protein